MRFLLSVLAAASLLYAADVKLGKPLKAKDSMTVANLLAEADKYVGKTVQVKGKVAEVCQEMGCWMTLTNNDAQTIRIKVEDGVIVFPKDSVGKTAVAEGKLSKIEGDKPQYEIAGTGAVILEN